MIVCFIIFGLGFIIIRSYVDLVRLRCVFTIGLIFINFGGFFYDVIIVRIGFVALIIMALRYI